VTTASYVPLTLKHAASLSSNYITIENSDNTVMFKLDKDDLLTVADDLQCTDVSTSSYDVSGTVTCEVSTDVLILMSCLRHRSPPTVTPRRRSPPLTTSIRRGLLPIGFRRRPCLSHKRCGSEHPARGGAHRHAPVLELHHNSRGG